MAKTLRFIIIIFILLLLSGCGTEVPAEGSASVSPPMAPVVITESPAPVPVPKFINADYIDLDQIQRISLFRSGAGHDYSDAFESCRSMKHYFVPDDEVDWSAIPIYSPVEGEIIKIAEEWAGSQIQIRPVGFLEYFIVIFHVDLDPELEVGRGVSAGQILGTHDSHQTFSDIAVGGNAQEGFRWISYFVVMAEDRFEAYQLRGVPERDALIISRQDRDADPLVCEGDQFTDQGGLENYYVLDEAR